MRTSEAILEFDKVKEIWKEYALTEYAKAEIDEAKPILRETELRARLRETTEAKDMLLRFGTPPLISLSGIKEDLNLAHAGGCLSPESLERIGNAVTAASRLKKYLTGGKAYDIPLAYYEESLFVPEALREHIAEQIRGGAVDRNATSLLRSLYQEYEETERKMREKADAFLRANKAYMADSFSTMRNGHVCVPVKAVCKNKVKGSVMGQSATGSTVFVEPEQAAGLYAEKESVSFDIDNEIRRILYTLSAEADEHREALLQNIAMIEKLDFIFSKAKLSIHYNGTEPCINTERRIRIKDGRHPLMKEEENVPLQFSIGDGVSGVVITGPNTGGKTVAIKTVALNAMMAQTGLHVACKEADFCMNANYLCDIGDGQNLSENLSTFSAHIQNVLEILSELTKDSLVIMDELGSGTDPQEGMGIAVAILEELRKSGALFLVTTHYPEVKQYAEETEGIENARMTFDKESLRPLYQLVIGEAGESCAFYIAGKMGMPKEMLRRAARAAYGNERLPKELEQLSENGKRETEGRKKCTARIEKQALPRMGKQTKYQRGDSVEILPDHKIGIVCTPENEKGVLLVQLPNKRIHINHKRVKLKVAAAELYPEDYDFSVIFDTVENRKKRHDIERGKMIEGEIVLRAGE